ncbi:MAG TPA: hypothetical protein VGS19_02405 [Streptosporangiaceae bacterium]|nr:hypothetical protein [Streptosporangiaceae bacterium]
MSDEGGRHPAESTWVTAVYAEGYAEALGTAVVIDRQRLLTCAHVCSHLIDENGDPKGGLWAVFSRFAPPSSNDRGGGAPRRRVVRARLSDPVYDLAILHLEGVVPAGVQAARLRRPMPDYLIGRGWWAAGFPRGQVHGNAASGTVGAALSDGFVRLDTRSRYGVEIGFSGGGLWSPDYDAVVGVVGVAFTGDRADDRVGDGLAITFYQAGLCFSEESLSALAGWSAEQAGEVALSSWGWALQDDPEAGQHWRPRARGVGVDSEGGFRFRGRRAALTAITSWLGREPTGRRALVVTGSPGVGKSAVLGRIVTTADPVIADSLPADDVVRAAEGSVACAVHAKGKTALEVATEIARAASAMLPAKPLELAPAIRAVLTVRDAARFNVIIDALDEATSPAEARLIVNQIVLPVLQQCGEAGVRVVIGSRRRDNDGALVETFGDAGVVIDLDSDEYFLLEDLEAYTLATLQQLGSERPGNPYSDQETARPLAARIAMLSGGNFLVARLTAGKHGLYDQEPADLGGLTYPMDVRNALQGYLGPVPGAAGLSAADLLTALAYAEAPGLTLDLWITAAEALHGVRATEQQLDEFTQSAAANFLVESSQDAEPVFRLGHQALNDTLLDARARRVVRDQRALTRAFLSYGRQTGWAAAPPYLLRSLPRHARPAGLIDELLTDDEYLLHADLRRLTPQASQATTDAGTKRARLLRLTPYAVSAGSRARTALFSVTEALEKLGDDFLSSARPAPYRACWSTVTTHLERAAQEGHTGGVTGLCAFGLAGRTLLASAGEDEMVRIWNPANGEQQRVLEGHSGAVNGVCAFTSGDGTPLLASAGTDAMVLLWDPATGVQQRVLEGHNGAVNGVCAFTSDGRTLLASAGADGMVLLWDPATGERQRVLEGHGGAVNVNGVCAYTRDGQTLLASAGTDSMVRIWDPATGAQQRALEGHSGAVWALCGLVSGAGRPLLASTGDDETVRVWDPLTGEQYHMLGGHIGGGWTVCAFTSDDGTTLLAAAGTDATVRVWDPATGEQRQTTRVHPGSVWSVCGFTSDDGRTLLASAGDHESVHVWDPATGARQQSMAGHSGGAWAVCPLTLAGHSLLAAAGHDGRVRLWDPVTGQLRKAFGSGTSEVWSVCAFTAADRTLLALAGTDSMVRIWDPATGEQQQALAGHVGNIWCTRAFTTGDGRTLLASAGDDGIVRVWNPVSGDLVRALKGHTGGVWSICAFAPEEGHTLLASAGADAEVRVWDPATGEVRRVLKGHTDGVWSVCSFTSGGRALLASCARSMAHVWDPTTSQTLQAIPVHLLPHVIGEVEGRLVLGLSAGLLTIELADMDYHEGNRG